MATVTEVDVLNLRHRRDTIRKSDDGVEAVERETVVDVGSLLPPVNGPGISRENLGECRACLRGAREQP